MKYRLKKLPQLDEVKRIYFIGIKGVGMAPLAIIAKQAKIHVSGSDLGEIFITDKYLNENRIDIDTGFDTHTIMNFFNGDFGNSLVVTTGAHKGFDNPQSIWAKENGLNLVTQGQALSIFMDGEIFDKKFDGISIAGSHGKTTISSLLATTLKASGLDPTYSVGTGEIFPLGSPGHYGHGKFFVAEADEYASEPAYDRIPKFLYQEPKYAIFNNVDFDHPDLFRDVNEVQDAFIEFAHNIKSGGKLFINTDDNFLAGFDSKVNKDIRIIKYGNSIQNDYSISKIVTQSDKTNFTVHKKGVDFGFFELSIPGVHNAKNALSVIAFMAELGYDPDQIKKTICVFTGTKRRNEIIGKSKKGALIIDDYGHHPLEIETTLSSLSRSHPDRKIICIFQPHTFSRTKSLLEDFGKAFRNIHKLILLPVFKSLRDTETDTLSIDEYIDVHKQNVDTEFFQKFEDVVEYVEKNYDSPDFIIVTMGAGDVYRIAEMIKK